nr:PHD and RING finger domain-containing protein 1-like [Onthophagus taurus]
MSEDSDKGPEKGSRKRLPEAICSSESSDSDSSFESVPKPKKIRVRNYISDSVSDSDSSIEIVHKRRVTRLNSDLQSNTSTSSGSDIIHLRRNARPLSNMEDSSDCSESEWELEEPSNNNPQIEASSETSGGEEREHCPICLVKFRNQDIGTPESCDHSFCLDCILEWAKKVQTCPVDRQPFGIVLHRESINGKVVNQVAVMKEEEIPDDDVVLDLTFCQICGSPDNEDTMLLCDACDMGYHMLCLDPPLDEIPEGVWMCPYCTPVHHVIGLELDQRNVMNRSLPRTRHMERVRSTIQTNRAQTTTRNTTSTSTTRRRRKKRTKRRTKIKIVYETNEITGETVAIETKVKQRRKRRKRKVPRRRNRAVVPKTVKKRLAAQLGICKLRTDGQLLPDVRISNNCNDLTGKFKFKNE